MSKPGRRTQRTSSTDDTLPDYRHRQPGRALVVLIGIPLFVCVLAAISITAHSASLWTLSALFMLVLACFASLTIEVTKRSLHWHFGPGLIRKQIEIADIASADIIRTRLIDGWGIHWTRHGWLYNVSGREAVAIKLKNGKCFALGSDDPVGLWEAIQNRLR